MSALSRLTLLAVTACCASAAHAVGLGPIELRSYLNEPLRADVVLRDVSSEGLDSISASIASESAYEELGIARNDYLRNVDATLVLVDGEPVVRLRGNRPLQEPLLELLVVVRDGRQLVQRSYTLFIDPPEFAQQPRQATPQASQPPAQATSPADPQTSAQPTSAETDSGTRTRAPAQSTTEEGSPVPSATAATAVEDTAGDAAQGSPEEGAQRTAEPAAEAGQPTASQVVEVPTPVVSETAAAEDAPTATERAPASAEQQGSDSPRFFTTESERQLDPELLAEIGQGPAASGINDEAAPRQPPARSSTNGFYPVRRGETLWRVAVNTRPAEQGITMQQMMLAIVRTNPNAFEAGDASELLAGARLRIPDAATIKSINPAAAERQMQALLSGSTTTQQAAASVGGTQDSTPASTAGGQQAQTGDSAEPAADDTPSQRAASEEAKPAADDAGTAAEPPSADTATARGDDAPAADPDASEQAPAAADTVEQGVGETAAEGARAEMADAAPTDTQDATEPEGASGDAPNQGEADASAPAEVAAAVPGVASEAETTVPSEATESPKASLPSTPATDAEEGATSAPPSAPASGPGTLFGLPWYLLLVGAGVVLLGVAGILEMRRRAAQRAAADADDEPRYANLTGQQPATAAAVDESEDAALEEAAPPAQEDTVDATQAGELGESASDDPLADADFRIAYGMYDDAAERLSDAILRDPENATLRLKLAEVHCAADDKERFLDAADAAARTGLSEAEERELAEMAERIAPDSRFATAIGASMTAGTVFAEANAPEKEQVNAADAGATEAEAGDFDALLGSADETTEPPAVGGALGNDQAIGGEARVDAVTEDSDADEADDDLAFGDDMAREFGDSAEPAAAADAEPGAGADASADADDNILEFDLDNLEFDDGNAGAVPAGAPSTASKSSAEDEAHALDFDLDSLDLPDTAAASAEALPIADDNALDFDWETPPTDAAADDTPAPEEVTPERSTVDDTGAVAQNAEGDSATAAGEATADPFESPDLDAGVFDLDDFSLEDFDLESDADTVSSDRPTGASEDAPTLELPEPEPAPAGSGGNEDAFALDDFEIDAGDESGTAGEDSADGVSGQLDLARAYVDMGEGDMARPLLEEILQTGSEVQRQEAQRLLDIAG